MSQPETQPPPATPAAETAAPAAPAPSRARSRRVVAMFIGAGVVLLGGLLAWLLWPSHPPLPPGVTEAMYETARAEFEQEYGTEADHVETLSWLAESLARDERWELAVAVFEEIPTDHPDYGHAARYQQGHILKRLGRAREAERHLREFVRREDRSPQMAPTALKSARQHLRHLLEIELRFEERRELLHEMIYAGHADWFDVLAYCFPTVLRWNGSAAVDQLETYWKNDPHDPVLRTALGRYRTGQGRLDEARRILEEVHRENSQDLKGAAALLACLHEQLDWEAMAAVVAELPPAGADDPWLLSRMRGHLHNHRGEHREAVACFRRALADDPANGESYLGLATAWQHLDEPQKREAALEKARTLGRIQNRLGWISENPQAVEPQLEVARMVHDIGLTQQAALMAAAASLVAPERPDVQALLQELERKLREQAAHGAHGETGHE